MNIIRMTGGLGNQMFQYALYLKYKALGTECRFDDFSEYENHDNARPIMLNVFGIDYPRANRPEVGEFTDSKIDLYSRIRRKITGRHSHEYRENSCNFDSELLSKDNSYIVGYFQTEKYFEDIKKDIIDTYTFKDNVVKDAERLINSDLSEYEDKVSIHIRRGDYLSTADVYGGICTEEYYESAIAYILKKNIASKFVLFSDDKAYAREKADKWQEKSDAEFTCAPDTTEDTGYLDMLLMSSCAHNIIANSSFSWWGAYLNRNPEKVIIAPSRWSNKQEYTDIYTDNMIKI